MGHTSNVVKANDEIIGVKVLNNADEDLGSIEEIMLDKTTGQVAYVVLKSGAILSMGGKLFALPWLLFNYDKNKECFRVNIDAERLKKAPGFDKDHWPDMADRAWGQDLSRYYNTKPYWERF